MLIKVQPDARVCRYIFTAKSLYMFRVSQFLVLLMMGAVTLETCRVTLQWINICILLYLVGFLLTLNSLETMPLKKVQPRSGLNWQFLATLHNRSPLLVLFPSILMSHLTLTEISVLSYCRQTASTRPLTWQQILTYLLTYLLTPWCRVLLEKPTGLQLVKKFPAFYGTWRFITALTSVRHLSLSWASPIQSIYPHPISWRCILILSTHLSLGLPSGLFLSGFPTKTLFTPFSHPYAPRAQPIPFFSILSPAQYWVRSTNHLAPRYAVSSIPPLPRPS